MRVPMDGVLFDLDGTLVDSLGDITHALNTALEAAGLATHPPERVAAMVGDGVTKLIERATPVGADTTALLKALTAHYTRNPVSRTRPFHGMVELLAELRGTRPLAVLSNKPHTLTTAVVQSLFGSDVFAEVVGARSTFPKKPAPQQALALAQRLGVAPQRCVMVGDSAVDVQTGHNAGMQTIAVTWGFRSRAQLEEAAPDHLVDTIDELRVALRLD